MALDKTELENNLEILYDATITGTADAATAKDNFIRGMADAIETYVKGAEIFYNDGLVAGSTPVVGTFNGSLV